MPKRTSQAGKKLFDIDFDSLLESEFFEINENNEVINDINLYTETKKVKTKDEKILGSFILNSESQLNKIEKFQGKAVEEPEDVNDFKSLFTFFGNDFEKSMEVKKVRLGKFTDSIISLYHTKITEMNRQQEKEMDDFKKEAINNFKEHLKKFEDEFYMFKQQENRLIKMLEQHFNLMEKFSLVQREWIENFKELHQFYVQNLAELINKHRGEALNLKEVMSKEISSLQNKFLMEIKKEEMLNMKKYLSDSYF